MSELGTIKGFHAVEEARKWKQEVSKEIEHMSSEEIVAYFRKARENYLREIAKEKENEIFQES